MAGEVKVVDDESKLLTPVDDVFAAAFDQLTEDTPKVVPEPKEPVVAEGETPPAPVVAEGGEGLPPTEAEKAAQAAADAEAARVAAEAAKPDARASQAPQIDAAELARQIVEASKPKEPAPQQVDNTPPLFSQEELGIIEQYNKDFPDIAKAEALVRRAEYRNVVQYMFGEITKELRPLVETVQLLSSRVHLGDIQRAVPDYAVTRDQAVEWANKQPDFLRDAYNQVIERGTAEQVTQLIQLYKAANPAPVVPAGGTPPPARAAAPKGPVPKVLDPAAKAALAALTPVATKRSNAAVTVSADDFDGAFEEAAKLFANAG